MLNGMLQYTFLTSRVVLFHNNVAYGVIVNPIIFVYLLEETPLYKGELEVGQELMLRISPLARVGGI